MFRRIFVSGCMILAVVSFVVPWPYYLLVFRPIRDEYEEKNAESIKMSRAAVDQASEAQARRKGAAIKMLRTGRDGDMAVYTIGEIASRYDVEISHADATAFDHEVLRPLGPPMSRASRAMHIQGIISVIALALFLILANVALWARGFLRGLLAGLLGGLVAGGIVAPVWIWLALRGVPFEFIVICSTVAGGALVCGAICGLLSRLIPSTKAAGETASA